MPRGKLNAVNTSDKVGVLARSTVFRRLPHESLTLLAEVLGVDEFPSGSTVCERGDQADNVFIVASGTLAVFVDSRVVRRLAVGDVVGEYGMFGAGVRTATVRAETDALLLAVDYERFRSFLFAMPEAMWALFGIAAERLAAAERT